MYDLIEKKKKGMELSKEEICFIVEGYTNGEIPDYQMSSFLMAVYFKGMNKNETFELTMAMAKSGDMLDLSGIDGVKIDKHSTGGVGDKTTLILGPLVAACGVPVAKMSGRGLGHTGGTIDKLESIPGFNTSVSLDEFIENVNDIKIVVAGQTANLAPADKKIYALRDVTATVDNISLIASSIMSKKLASGADGIVLDVKCGNGAFMKDEQSATALAKEMVDIGRKAGRITMALITDMNQPLGNYVGNALEVEEAVAVLQGKGPKDLEDICVALGARMILAAGVLGEDIYGNDAQSVTKAEALIREKISNGEGFDKFCEFVKAQGGDVSYISDTKKLPKATIVENIIYNKGKGYVKKIQTENIGKASLVLGGGRLTKESAIDMSVGIVINKKIGDMVEDGQVIAVVHGNDRLKVEEAKRIVLDSYTFSDKPTETPKLIKNIVF